MKRREEKRCRYNLRIANIQPFYDHVEVIFQGVSTVNRFIGWFLATARVNQRLTGATGVRRYF